MIVFAVNFHVDIIKKISKKIIWQKRDDNFVGIISIVSIHYTYEYIEYHIFVFQKIVKKGK